MNMLWILLGVAGAYVLVKKDELFGPSSPLSGAGGSFSPGGSSITSGLTANGAALVSTSSGGTAVDGGAVLPPGARVETSTSTAAVIPPGGVTPVDQTVTRVLVNHDPGNPTPGSVLIDQVNLSRQQGYYTPDPLTAGEKAILRDLLAQYRGDERTVLSMMAGGLIWDYTGQFKRTFADWNSYAGGANVPETYVGSRWGDKVNQEEYVTTVNAYRSGVDPHAGQVATAYGWK